VFLLRGLELIGYLSYASKAKWGNAGDCRVSSTESYGKFALGYIARRDVSSLDQ